MVQRRQIEDVAREALGFTQLRPGQAEAVEALVEGRDVLAVMPTGSGKSAIYQIAAALVDGPTVVISPLIALQSDQVEKLSDADVGAAAAANSSVSAGDRREAFQRLRAGNLEFLFLAPEQFNNEKVLAELAQARPSLLVVDEAHCISSWGHDFRPEYLRLGAIARALGRPRIVALTATASPPVREEIVDRLELHDPLVLVRGFDRPNIHLGVELFEDERAKREALVERVVEGKLPGIVYVATRAQTDEVATALRERGLRARHYHAGLKASEREEVQDEFMGDGLDVIVATTAFGMGIDKAKVEFVHHFAIPDSIDSYYQEIGRGGRDGAPAQAILFYRPADVGLRRYFVGSGHVGVEELQEVAEAVADSGGPVEQSELREETELSKSKVSAAVTRLGDAGGLDVLADGEVEATSDLAQPLEVVREAERSEQRHRHWEESRVEMMRGYAETTACRRRYILNYFGEPYELSCGNCDNDIRRAPHDSADEPFALNTRVAHSSWGEGVVVRYEPGKVAVLFDDVGYKTLALELVVQRGLLQVVE